MNPAQRFVIFVSVVVFVASAVFPPFLIDYSNDRVLRKWALLFAPPHSGDTGSADIDWTTLAFEWCVILMATAPTVWLFGRRARPDKTMPVP